MSRWLVPVVGAWYLLADLFAALVSYSEGDERAIPPDYNERGPQP